MNSRNNDYLSLVENSPEYVIKYDNEQRILFLNSKLVKFLDFPTGAMSLAKGQLNSRLAIGSPLLKRL